MTYYQGSSATVSTCTKCNIDRTPSSTKKKCYLTIIGCINFD